jgi:hypothetical protein
MSNSSEAFKVCKYESLTSCETASLSAALQTLQQVVVVMAAAGRQAGLDDGRRRRCCAGIGIREG